MAYDYVMKKRKKRTLGVYAPPNDYRGAGNPMKESQGDTANRTAMSPMAAMESAKRTRPKRKKRQTIYDLGAGR